jgi:putative spermidine/putrescine transport system ATP-binding protein
MTVDAYNTVVPAAAPARVGSARSLELEGITKRYGDTVAVRDVTLGVEEGEFLTFLGQSGSGKTTVLKLVAGFEVPDGGTIRIGGADVSGKPPRDREVGMVFQHYALFPHLTVADNVAYGLRRRGWRDQRRDARVKEMLELVRLGDYARRRPHELSGGQQQRVAVARALAFEPRLLLMDEPLGALDRALRLDLEQELRRIHRTTGASVVYVTHDRDEALALSSRIAVFHEGRLVALDTPPRLYDRPATAYVARLLTDANLTPLPGDARRTGDRVEIALGGRQVSVRASADAAGGCERLAIPRVALSLQPAEGRTVPLAAEVRDVVFLGEFGKLELDSEALGPLVAHVPVTQVRAVTTGTRIDVHLDLERCLVVT